jgi:hypothetical protein
MSFSIEGTYYLDNSTLKPTDKNNPELVIRHRKTATKGKPDIFLAVHKPAFNYISSLFGNNKDIALKSYELDYQKTKYQLDFEPENNSLKAVIKRASR